MIENITYGFTEGARGKRLHVDVPSPLWARTQQTQSMKKLFEFLKQKGVGVIEEKGLRAEHATRLLVTDRSFGRMESPRRTRALSLTLLLLKGIEYTATEVQRSDPLLRAQLDVSQENCRLLSPVITMTLPGGRTDGFAQAATDQMQDMADKIKFVDHDAVAQHVYAAVGRSKGILSLHVGHPELGQASMGVTNTAGQPLGRDIELRANNITVPDQQLIALAGAVAIAHYSA